jgi:hypothetical protein
LGENGFCPFFFLPLLHLVLYKYVLGRLFGGFSHLFSFPCFNFFLWLSLFLAKMVCDLCPWSECNLILTNSQV